MKLRLLLSAFAALALAVPVVASADAIAPPSLTINGWSPSLTALGCASAGSEGQSSCTGTNIGPGSGAYTLTSWNVYLDPDPTVVGFIAIQNNALVAQTFSFTFLLPIVAQGPQVQVNGSISGSLTDANGNGATLDSTAPAVYEAQIDGLTVQTLLNHPQPQVVAGAFGSTPWGGAGFGPTVLNQTANATIAINVDFTLSPGDLASFTSVFNVVAVPEPATLVMLSGGLVGLLAFGGRRSPRA
jgi:hypothetical protein